VAATRARDHLVVSVFHPEPRRTEPAPDARRLMEAAAAAPDTWLSLVAVGPPPAPAPASPQAQPLDSVPMAIEEWRAARATLLARQLRRTVMAATELAHVRHAENDGEEGDAVFRRGRAGTSVGRAVHAVLQTVDLATGDGLTRLATAQAAAEGVPALAGDVERLARAALGSDPVREALAAGRYWREAFVSAEHEGVLVEGFIDLLYETPAGLVIVDYKTDSVRDDAEIAAAMDGYRLQGATYAYALQRNLGRPVAGCRFLFLRGGEPRVIAVDDLPGAVAEVQARVSAAALEPLVHSADSARG
jgi:ATP-dependent helicase/nuclease subunit A